MEFIPDPVSPSRIILCTTGRSRIVDYLCDAADVSLAGIIECRKSDNDCSRLARENGTEHSFFENFTTLGQWLDDLHPDLIITYRVPFLLPEGIFEKPRLGSVNIHPSLLPAYRGPNPWFWVYYNMEPQSGVTIHKLDKYEDHGDILAQGSFPVEPGSPLDAMRDKADQVAVGLLDGLLKNWEKIEAVPQSGGEHTRAPNNFNTSELLDLKVIHGRRLWHILRGFPALIHHIIPGIEGRYGIGDFSESSPTASPGTIETTWEGTYLICSDGRIKLIPAQGE